jgi:hypothetical protein
MNELLQNPAVQAGVVPFLMALAASAVLGSTRFLGLGQVGGFLALVALAIGFSFEPMTAMRKLIVLGTASGLAVLLLEVPRQPRKEAAWGVLALLALGTVWMLWRLLVQRELPLALLAGGLSVAFVVALAASMLHVSARSPIEGAAAGVMIGLGMGALAVLGASAVLALAAISVGAGAGAALLVQMLRGQSAPVGASIALPAATVAALAGVLATQTASLPWFALLPVLAAPWAVRLVPARLQAVWLRAFAAAALALVPMLVAVAVAVAWAAAPGAS